MPVSARHAEDAGKTLKPESRGEPALNHPELHWLKTVVVNIAGKGVARLRQVRSGKMSDGRKSSVVDVSK